MGAGKDQTVTRERIEEHLRLVQDLDLPFELFALIADAPRLAAYGAAIARALAENPGARVICHGPGALLWSMTAAAAGATVAIAEPGTYFAPLIREVVAENKLAAKISVTHGGLLDLPPSWNHSADLVILDCLDSALFGRGLLGSARFARANLLRAGGAMIPRSARLYTVPGELLLGPQCGFDLGAVDDYRGVGPNELTSMVSQGFRQLADPRECASIDLLSGVEAPHTLEFQITRRGRLNTLGSWYALDVDDSASLDNAPREDDPTRAQAAWFFAEPIDVDVGEQFGVSTTLCGASGIGFSTDRGRLRSFGHVRPTLPAWHFPMIADARRNQAFVDAIDRALDERPGARVLDIGAGNGLLALAAARAGAEHVLACEMVPHIAELTRAAVAKNEASSTIEVIARASYELSEGDYPQRASLLVSETVDHGLLGERFLISLAHARGALLEKDAKIIPGAATLYMTPIDLHTGQVLGFDLRAIDQLRLGYFTGLKLEDTPHVLLSEPQAVYRFDFQAGDAEPARTRFEVPITRSGVCGGVAIWFDLELDDTETISTAPGSGITAWDQGMIFFDQTLDVDEGEMLPIFCDHDLERVAVYPDPDFVEHNPQRTWPIRRGIWNMGLRVEAAGRSTAGAALMQAMSEADPPLLERIWRSLTGDDPKLAWVCRDLLARIYAQAGDEL